MDYNLTKKLNEKKERWDITVTGEIDIFNSAEFKENLLSIAKEKQLDLYIDCTNLQYIDSTALGALVAVLKTVKTYDKEIFLVNVKPSLVKLFKITNLDKVFIIEGDLNE